MLKSGIPITNAVCQQIHPTYTGPFEEAFALVLDALRTSLPPGFEETILNGMPTFVVPLSKYPAGYHCTPGKPLPFISIAARTSGISLHHLGLYSMPELLEWFTAEYPKYSRRKLDMGKGCVRFKKQDDIPLHAHSGTGRQGISR
jgi:hypothetical protein